MKRFFRENYALVAGIVLPLTLIAIFFLAGKVTVMSVPDPQFDAVFATYYRDTPGNPYKLGVDDGKLYILLRPTKHGGAPRFYQEPVVYVFDHKTLYAKKIDINFDKFVAGQISDPELDALKLISDPALDALNRHRINPDPVSRDGYKLEDASLRGGGLFTDIFGSRRSNRNPMVLRNGVRSIPVVGPETLYFGYFIGWVEK